jgi:chromosomal replication initiator protein
MEELNNNNTFNALHEYTINTFALDAAKAIVINPGKAYNPFYLYSKKGTGKTHLVQAMANEYLKQGRKVTYVTSEKFCADMDELYKHYPSLMGYENTDFKKLTAAEIEINRKILKNDIFCRAYNAKYKENDVLIVEDIEYLKGRGTGTELFYLVLPELMDNNRQAIFTAHKSVEELENLDEEDKAALREGLCVDI